MQNFCVKENSTIIDALKIIDNNKKGFALLIDDQNMLLGVLTDGDIRRALISGKKLHDMALDVCNKKFIYLNVDAELKYAIDIFKDDKVKFIPILNHQGQAVNVITRNNLHAILLKGIFPDLSYDFTTVDDTIVDYEIYQRPWGFYKTTILNDMFQSKVINVRPKGELSLQMHKKREEYWIIVNGKGKVVLDESIIEVKEGSTIFIPKGCKHRITNTSDEISLIFIEVQRGTYFGEDDIIRFDDIYGRK